jgi:hypothetical protein
MRLADKVAVITGAALGAGLFDMEGNAISPPPYFDVAVYEGSVRLLQELSPRRLLTAHYEVMEGEGATRFLEESIAFVEHARRVVSEALSDHGELNLRGLLETANPEIGPFTVMENELAGTLGAHVRELVAVGKVEEVPGSEPKVWKATARR